MHPREKKLAVAEQKEKPPIRKLIRELREYVGQSQTQFARMLNITKDAVAQWEAGRREPNRWLQEKLYKLAQRCEQYDLARRIFPPRENIDVIVQRALALERSEGKTEITTPPVENEEAWRSTPSSKLLSQKQEMEEDLLRIYNDATMGLNLLYEAAQKDRGAREVLADLADKLTARGGNWQRMKYLKKKGG